MKKATRLIALVLALMFVLALAAPVASAATYKYVKTSTSGSYVNLRKSKSTSSSSLGKVYDGTRVEYLGKSGDWSQVKVAISGKTVTGYIKSTYLTSTASSSSGSTGATGSVITTTGPGVTNRATYLYKKASTSATKVVSLSKGASITVTQMGTNWVKATYGTYTGYIPKKYVYGAATSSAGDNAAYTGANDDIITGVYTTSTISRPTTATSKEGYWNAINYNLTTFPSSFTVAVSGGESSWHTNSVRSLEFAFISAIKPSGYPKGTGNVNFTVTYNEAGQVAAYYTTGKSITDSRARNLQTKVASILSAVNGKSDYEKVVYFHDYIVGNCQYDSNYKSGYDCLMTGKAQCKGYAEAMALLLTCAKIENRFVWAKSKMSETGTHGFNKVKVDGVWYNVDCTVDDPINNDSNVIKRDFLLVSDAVSAQRYAWETKRYPSASTENNWHHRNNLVADSQSELQSLITTAKNSGASFVSIWVPNYNTSNYSLSKLTGIRSTLVTGASSSYSTWGTAVYVKIK